MLFLVFYLFFFHLGLQFIIIVIAMIINTILIIEEIEDFLFLHWFITMPMMKFVKGRHNLNIENPFNRNNYST